MGGRWRVSLVMIVLGSFLGGCIGAAPEDGPQGDGPLETGLPVQSPYVVSAGSEVGWGLVTLRSPDERAFTITNARAIANPPDAALAPAYALEWPRDIGAIQWSGWPPTDADLGGTPTPLPATVPAADSDGPGSTEVFVGVRSQDPWVHVTGIEIEYTDGKEHWTDVVPHDLLICSKVSMARCERLQVEMSSGR